MKTIELTVAIVLPEDASDEEIQEWVDFALTGGSISMDNPLVDTDLKDLLTMREDFGVVEYDCKVTSHE